MDQQLAEKLTLICESIQRSLEVDSVLLSIPGANGLSSVVSDSDAPIGSFADPTMGSETPDGRPDPVFVEEDVSSNAESSEYLLTLGYSDIRFYAELAVQGARNDQIALVRIMDAQPRQFGVTQRTMFRRLSLLIRQAMEGRLIPDQPSIDPTTLVQSICRAQELLLNPTDCQSAYDTLLKSILSLTHSPMGFIGSVSHDAMDGSFIKLLALSDEPQCPQGAALLKRIQREGMVFRRLDNLLGAAISEGRVVISQDLANDTRIRGFPKGHPSLSTYMGIPVFSGESVIGLIGLADRPEGYTQELADELKPLSQTVGMLIDRHRLKIETARNERRVERARNYDALTCLPSGPMLTKRLMREVHEADRAGSSLSVCIIDVDGFKRINDRFGQACGDEVLKTIALRLKNAIRPRDLVAKLRGDEFLVTLRDANAGPSAYRRLLSAIAEPIAGPSTTFALSASMGVTVYPLDQSDPDILLRHASLALYRAKESGAGQFVTFDIDDHEARREQRRILESIETGFKRSEFQLFYQPRINFRTGAVDGFEGLIRWNHPERGLLLPYDFLGATESTKYESVLGNFVIRTALTTLRQFEADDQRYTISINISPHHFLADDFIPALQAHLRGVSTQLRRRLVLEVLESTAIEDVSTATHTVEACQALGVTVSLDDFGTGFSSLTYFRDLPVDEIKIDKSFVMGMLGNPSDRAIVESIVSLSKRFNRRVVAEGVETKALAQALRKLKCDFGQGYYFSVPLPLDEALAWADEFSNRR
ncbi:putative bifunctional diguanylate cyclase/phosphodiesterase [Marinobacter guineae]|nr:GGDEF domain-containing protein [Marinobacter guineae]